MRSMQKEEQLLSHSRYNKMKILNIKEAQNVIIEEEHEPEPTASLFEPNQLYSITYQNEKESLEYIETGPDHIQSSSDNKLQIDELFTPSKSI